MEWSIEIDPERRLVRRTVRGPMTEAEAWELAGHLRAHPHFRPDYDELFDMRDATVEQVTSKTVWDLAWRSPLFLPTARRAAVVSNDVDFGIMRMLELASGDRSGEMRVFRDMESAERWLAEANRG